MMQGLSLQGYDDLADEAAVLLYGAYALGVDETKVHATATVVSRMPDTDSSQSHACLEFLLQSGRHGLVISPADINQLMSANGLQHLRNLWTRRGFPLDGIEGQLAKIRESATGHLAIANQYPRQFRRVVRYATTDHIDAALAANAVVALKVGHGDILIVARGILEGRDHYQGYWPANHTVNFFSKSSVAAGMGDHMGVYSRTELKL